MAQQRSDPLMARTERVDLPLRSMPPGPLIEPELMESMSLLVPWAIGWEVRTKLLLRLNKLPGVMLMLLEVQVFLMLLLQTIALL
jgi:hypothetical protein